MSDTKRIQLNVVGISYSQIQSGAYALILGEVDGPYRIPIVIGGSEAQSIAIRLEKIIPPRPMTHDLFVSFAHAFGVKLDNIFIYKFEDGIFYSELTFTDGERTVVLDGRTSDAIGIALRAKAPIFTTREILEDTGFIMEEVDTSSSHASQELQPDDMESKIKKLHELENSLQESISEERYEEAAKISAQIDILRKEIEENDN
ncbi:bifunctional nuclease family protein [uncultured Muribaculum sp.]|uniref:bifunctional nuclease family protein n=1 Tax=uncultured Muribaculum sp. TaxID=1918613 RepID=UPI0025944590|nr:bifunctional nuclease family protein [uncultured Muribaculum sp.]